MPNLPEDIVSYIRSGAAAGNSPEQMRQTLQAAGWPAEDIEKAFASLAPPAKKTFLRKWEIAGGAAAVLLAAGAIAYAIFLSNFTPAPVPPENPDAPGALNQAPPTNSSEPPPLSKDAASGEDGNVPVVSAGDYSDLQLPVVDVPESENAYLDPAALGAVTTASTARPGVEIGGVLSGAAPWDQVFAEDVVKNNRAAISALAAAIPRQGFQIPEWGDPAAVSAAGAYSNYGRLIDLSRVAALEALLLSKSGDAANGAAEAMVIALYGQRMATSQIDTFGYMAGLQIKDIGLKALQSIAVSGSLKPDEAKLADGLLASFEDTGPALADAFKVDFWAGKARFEDILRDPGVNFPMIPLGKFQDRFLLDAEETLGLLADSARGHMAMAGEACKTFADPPPPDAEEISKLEKLDTENSLGRLILMSSLSGGGAALNNQRCDDAALLFSVRASLAAIAGR